MICNSFFFRDSISVREGPCMHPIIGTASEGFTRARKISIKLLECIALLSVLSFQKHATPDSTLLSFLLRVPYKSRWQNFSSSSPNEIKPRHHHLYLSEKILALPVAVYRRKYSLLWRLLEASSPSSSPTDRR